MLSALNRCFSVLNPESRVSDTASATFKDESPKADSQVLEPDASDLLPVAAVAWGDSHDLPPHLEDLESKVRYLISDVEDSRLNRENLMLKAKYRKRLRRLIFSPSRQDKMNSL